MAPTEARRVTDRQGALSMVDHDLLIRINTQLEALSAKVDDHHNEKTARWENLERDKADKQLVATLDAVVNKDHETRIRAMESLLFKGLGGLAVMQVIITIGLVIMQIVLRK